MVHALHVHHGLVAQADGWLQQVQSQSRRWGAQFHATRLDGAPAAGESVEAWARRGRYRALATMARAVGCSLVLLAHHRRDQAETLLLQALRGGGPAGLAAMPRQVQREGLTWARPWLDLPREAIEAYVRSHRLRFADDASNGDDRFARNRLRSRVWPALEAAFPDAQTQLRAAALRAGEAAACLAELAEADAAHVLADGALIVERWRVLSGPRRTLLLRHWLRGAPESLVQRLAAELPGRRQGRWPGPQGELRLHDGRLAMAAPLPKAPPPAPATFDLSQGGGLVLPDWQGRLVAVPVADGGVAPARLRAARLAPRSGGEQFQLAPRGTPRSLKKQFQALRVPAWERAGPLVYAGDLLLFVPGPGHRRTLPRRARRAAARTALGADGSGPLESRAFRPTPARLSMALIVHKYGGTSMGSTERIRNVAMRVAKWVRAGHQLVVVPSAMSGETNRLLGLAKELSPTSMTAAAQRELDAIAATGEQVSVGLLALALQAQGLQAVSYAGWQVPVATDSAFTKARISSIDDTRVRADLAAGRVVVITGFQGIDGQGNVTTLGRGGSDTSAVAVAAAMKADECLIYTDVDGVYTTDPRVVPEARRLSHRELRGNAGDGQPGLQGAADPLGGVCRQVQACRMRVLSSFTPWDIDDR